MYRASYIAAAAITAVAGAQTASAQLTLGLDINGFEYEFLDATGASGFGGENHTGTMRWSFSSDEPRLVHARMGDEGPFGLLEPVSIGEGLADLDATINLDSGRIRGGELRITLTNGDSYTADFAGGRLVSLGRSGYTLDARTLNGVFSDDQFGDIALGDLARPGDFDGWPGWALAFRFNPTAAEPSGTADVEVFVMVPLPPTALAGLGTLAGVMGFSIARRRRMT